MEATNNSKIFRKVALERAASPEQLDLLMRVTNPRSWLALLGLILLLGAGVAWSLLGQIPVQVSASAILVKTGGIKNVASLYSGQISELYVGVGDTVEEGQPIAAVIVPGKADPVEIKSPYTGSILEIKTAVGDLISQSSSLASLEFTGAGIEQELLMYVSPLDSKRIAPGMAVRIEPVTVTQEEYGYLLGEVLTVNAFPASQSNLLSTLGSQEFVDILATTSAPTEVRIKLLTDPNNASGYQWSASDGPAFEINSGTFATANIVVGNSRPIDLVLPLK
jgi:hypothetical protein